MCISRLHSFLDKKFLLETVPRWSYFQSLRYAQFVTFLLNVVNSQSELFSILLISNRTVTIYSYLRKIYK